MNQPLPGMPDNPEFTEDHAIPRRAEALLRMLMDEFQRLWDTTMAYPKKVEGDERTWVINKQVDLFGQVYLLAALRQRDAALANAVAAGLADQWDTGDSLGEWMYQWRKELDADLPLSLPCAWFPTDSPAVPAGPRQPNTAGEATVDWRRIAMKLVRTGVGFYGLTTAERDAIEDERDREAIAEDVRAERSADAATGLEGR